MLIRNDSPTPIDFVVRGKAVDGVPPTRSIAPGEIEDIDVDPNSADVVGRAAVGAITLFPDAAPVDAPAKAKAPDFIPLSAPAKSEPDFKPLSPKKSKSHA